MNTILEQTTKTITITKKSYLSMRVKSARYEAIKTLLLSVCAVLITSIVAITVLYIANYANDIDLSLFLSALPLLGMSRFQPSGLDTTRHKKTNNLTQSLLILAFAFAIVAMFMIVVVMPYLETVMQATATGLGQ